MSNVAQYFMAIESTYVDVVNQARPDPLVSCPKLTTFPLRNIAEKCESVDEWHA